MSGLGTASNTSNSSGTTSSQTAPWNPAVGDLTAQLGNAGNLTGYGAINPNSANMWYGSAPKTGTRFNNAAPGSAMGAAEGLGMTGPGSPGAAASTIGKSFETGDPTGLLGSGMSSYTGNVAPIANMDTNPNTNPETAQMIQALNDQITQSVNGQFAGAGRSLSGYNQKDLGMGLTEGEAPTLFNQYNTNVANKMAANQGILGAGQSTQALENANKQAGVQLQSSAYPLSQLPFQTVQQAWNTPATNAAQLAGNAENLTIPIAGLGGQTSGTAQQSGTGTNTASPLYQMAQGTGILGNLFGPMV